MPSAVGRALFLQRTVGNHAVEKHIKAQAYAVGPDVVFGAPALQRQPKKRDPDAERAEAVRRAQADLCTADQIDVQSVIEDKLKLNWKKRAVKSYAWAVGAKDRDRIRKSGMLSPELQQEIIVKFRFFDGEAKPAYLQTIAPTVAEYADPDQVIEITNAPSCATVPAKETTQEAGVPCDLAKHEFLLLDEADPSKSRCMDIDTDPEFNNVFDFHIVRAVGYAVPGTTWENVEYDRFLAMQVFYDNGKSEYFMLNQVGDFHVGSHPRGLRDHVYVKRATGLIYPVSQGGISFNEVMTPTILKLKNGLRYQTKQLKELYDLLQVAGSFASILGLYGLGVESFKASVSAFKRVGPARLAGRPLPGIGVKKAPTPKVQVESAFGELGGGKKGFKIHLVDDASVIETPTSRSNIGIATRHAGGAVTDPVSKQIWVHQSLVEGNGLTRKWGATLDLKQVIAHELGHGINKGGPCALASRTGADLPGLTAVQRTGLLDDAVHISRASSTLDERVSLPQLRLPAGYTPPKP